MKKINFYKKKEKTNENLNNLISIYVEAITKIDPKLAHKNEIYTDMDDDDNDVRTSSPTRGRTVSNVNVN